MQELRARVTTSFITPDVERVLDVGCGNGFVSNRLKPAHDLVGVDSSREALRSFEGKGMIGSCDQLMFPDRSFDAVLCLEVLEHLDQKVFSRTIGELARVARKYLMLSVPYREKLLLKMTSCACCSASYHVDLHQRTFSDVSSVAGLFPEFVLDASSFVGFRWEIRPYTYSVVRYALLGPEAKHYLARCPHCGSSETQSRKGSMSKLSQWVFDGLGWRMQKVRVPHWLIVRLMRTEDR